jgi:hypothetical protein
VRNAGPGRGQKSWTTASSTETNEAVLTNGKAQAQGAQALIEKSGRHSDGDGLYFRTLGLGRAYWVFRYRANGKEREMSLGPFPELSLSEARAKHAAARKAVVVDKADPAR